MGIDRRDGLSSCCGPQPDRRTPGAGDQVMPGSVAGEGASGSHPGELVSVPAGPFVMGSEAPEGFPADGEGPLRQVEVGEFRIGATAVTVAEYAAFVEATDHRTDAERYGWSFVFHHLLAPGAEEAVVEGQVPETPWWLGIRGADWRHPGGPGSAAEPDHPVVHVSHRDASAYAAWVGGRLPTEAEWEKAARGGLEQASYPWGDELTPGGEHRANLWQGTFPSSNSGDDGWLGTAPVRSFPANGLGLYETSGNVWEWTADWFSPHWHRRDQERTRVDPTGPPRGTARVVRGGSYLCHRSYCNRYRVAARTQTEPDTTLGHTGFRVAFGAE
nr:formylglycine-generating enzyme family protein [Parenemella sanctibonifatiensis]